MAPHTAEPLPKPDEHRQTCFLENTRGLRRTLLARRAVATVVHVGHTGCGSPSGRPTGSRTS
ncbi:hypothetical protein [Streptomyces sp. NPDC060275]|uniref:hypothetical protein n=1 Tax=Streptomyces sp. NPDC060275 TaxID=3347090 RepID=UPI003651D436